MSDFGFVGGAYQSASLTQNASELINWYVEIDPTKGEGERGVIALYPTPGLDTQLDLSSGEWRGLYVLPGGQILLGVLGNKVYSITTGYVQTEVGTLNTSAGKVYITDNGSSAYLTDGVARYYYTWGSATFAVLASTDGAFEGANVCDVVDNFIIYNRPGFNQWGCTDVTDVVSGGTNLGTKIGYTDNIVSVVADHTQVLLFGEVYSERHVNVGAFPFPFARSPGSAIQHGLQAQNSVAMLGEGVAFLARDKRGQVTVAMWGAAFPVPQRISTFAIENAIQTYSRTDDAIGYSYIQGGHEFYVLTFPTADVTWCYDIATGFWHRRAWRDPNTGVYHRHRSNCCALFNGQVVVGDYSNGKLYAFSQSKFTDAGDPLPCLRRCKHLTSNLRRQFFHDLQVQFQPGVGIQSGQGSDPEMILRWSNDGGFTFGNDHLVKIGKAGKYKNRAIKRRLGWARDRVYEVVVTDPVYRVVVSANLNASVGAN